MPIHDWTRVDDGTFHAFHTFWIAEIAKSLNDGLLPEGFYALPEQVTDGLIPDVVTLRDGPTESVRAGAALAVPPAIRHRSRPLTPARRRVQPRQVVVRRATGHVVVAVIEIVSPANKDRRDRVHEFTYKIEALLRSGVHVLVVDILPPGKHTPRGIHAAVWARFDRTRYQPPEGEPLTLASYRWDEEAREPEAFVEPTAVGRDLFAMPLFLRTDRFVEIPLEASYRAAFASMPAIWRGVLNGLPG